METDCIFQCKQLLYNKTDLIDSTGALNLKANTFFEEDIAAMLDSLQELFEEYGNDVTATLIAETDGTKTPQARSSPSSRLSLPINGV